MRAEPELSERIWREFGKRRFDNLCRGLLEFGDLDRRRRIDWYCAGEYHRIEAGSDSEVPQSFDYVFVVAGAVRADEVDYPAPSLFSIEAHRRIEAIEESRVVWLMDPARALASKASRAPLSVIASAPPAH